MPTESAHFLGSRPVSRDTAIRRVSAAVRSRLPSALPRRPRLRAAPEHPVPPPAGQHQRGRYLPKPSNSPFRTPPRNACHSSDVNRRTGPSASLLLRTPIAPPGRSATSTQLPLAKLRELLTQLEPEPGSPSVVLPTLLPHWLLSLF